MRAFYFSLVSFYFFENTAKSSFFRGFIPLCVNQCVNCEEHSGNKYYYEVYITHKCFPTKPGVEEQESIRKYEEKMKQAKQNYF